MQTLNIVSFGAVSLDEGIVSVFVFSCNLSAFTSQFQSSPIRALCNFLCEKVITPSSMKSQLASCRTET